MKVTVYVTPKQNILDPQGAAIKNALAQRDFGGVANLRVGKIIEFELDQPDTPEIRETINELARTLISNTVTEDYRIEIRSEVSS